MKENLVFRIVKDTINISKIKHETDIESLNKTNIIDTKDLKFSLEYINENFELVANFLNVVILKKNIQTVIINSNDIASTSLDLINTWDHVNKIVFKENSPVTLSLVLKIIDNKNIKNIDCYEMVDSLIQRIDMNTKIKVVTRHKNNYVSNFMKENFLENYTDIFYKKAIIITNETTKEELEDIKIFINTNEKLKTIKIFKFTNELITTIISELKNLNKKNINILIYEENNDINIINKTLNYIRKKEKKYLENNNIKLKIVYSDEYKKKYFFKEFNIKILSTIILTIIAILIFIMTYNHLKEYKDKLKTQEQINEIKDIILNNQTYYDINSNENDVEIISGDNLNVETTKSYAGGTRTISAYYVNYNKVFEELIKTNPETVGWLTINNTPISYPIVQHNDNDFYLNHDFNQRRNGNGWIYVDYRNEINGLDDNTIIYGHNLKSGIMFGNINLITKPSWYKNIDNQIITFNTLYANMKWQIFSLYRIKSTEDYLVNDFKSDVEKENFIKMIKGRSVYNFNVDVTKDDKILTISTCSDNGYKRAIHAKLVSVEVD